MSTPSPNLTPDQTKLAVKVVGAVVVVVPVVGGLVSAWLTSSPVDWFHAAQVLYQGLAPLLGT